MRNELFKDLAAKLTSIHNGFCFAFQLRVSVWFLSCAAWDFTQMNPVKPNISNSSHKKVFCETAKSDHVDHSEA